MTEQELGEFELEDELDDDQEDELEAELEAPAAVEGPVGPPQFNYNDRLYALGFSTTGKSEILNVIFSGVRCQRLLIDTKPEFWIPDVTPAHEPGELDWSAPILHYQPHPGSECDQYEAIFEQALTLSGPLVVCVHELQDLVDYRPQKAGRFLLGYAAKGARIGKGFLVGTQRPRLAPVSAITEARHVLVMVPQLARRDDNVTAAEHLSPVAGQAFTADAMVAELGRLQEAHGSYACLWKDRATGQLIALPPLPDHLRALSIVRRLEDGAPD